MGRSAASGEVNRFYFLVGVEREALSVLAIYILVSEVQTVVLQYFHDPSFLFQQRQQVGASRARALVSLS